MNTINRPLRARTSVPRALTGALQWRLLLLWIAATLLCALVGALPVWNWLASLLDHAVQAPAIAEGRAPGLLMEALAGAEAMLEGGADLLILNRFGKVEAEGGGGRALLARAVELGVPAVVAVPWRNIGAFRAFAGDLAEEIGPEAFALRAGELIACGPGMPSAFLR